MSVSYDSFNEQPQNLVKKLTGGHQEFLTEYLEKYPVVVVDVYADWCGPCKAGKERYEQMAQHYSKYPIAFVKDNIDDDDSVHTDLVSGVPAYFIYVNKHEHHKIFGNGFDELGSKLNEILFKIGVFKNDN